MVFKLNDASDVIQHVLLAKRLFFFIHASMSNVTSLGDSIGLCIFKPTCWEKCIIVIIRNTFEMRRVRFSATRGQSSTTNRSSRAALFCETKPVYDNYALMMAFPVLSVDAMDLIWQSYSSVIQINQLQVCWS